MRSLQYEFTPPNSPIQISTIIWRLFWLKSNLRKRLIEGADIFLVAFQAIAHKAGKLAHCQRMAVWIVEHLLPGLVLAALLPAPPAPFTIKSYSLLAVDCSNYG